MSIVHFLNVKNGDCNIIEHDSGRISIIDICCARKEMIQDSFSQLEESLDVQKSLNGNYHQKKSPENPISYLKNVIRTSTIFRYIQTHPDMDHMDGIEDLFSSFSVINFWDTENNKKEKIEESFRGYRKSDWLFYQSIRKSKTNPKVLFLKNDARGDYYCSKKGDGLYILSPAKDLIDYCNSSGKDYNELSYVILFYTHGKKIIFSGDSGKKSWDLIIDKYEKLVSDIDVLVAPHHGRKTGGNDNYLDILKPKITLFGNTENSGYKDYASWNNRSLLKITNNQAGNVVLEINDKNIEVYVQNKKFADKFKIHEVSKKYGYFIGGI